MKTNKSSKHAACSFFKNKHKTRAYKINNKTRFKLSYFADLFEVASFIYTLAITFYNIKRSTKCLSTTINYTELINFNFLL